MSFYSSISNFYDEIFPVDAEEMAFVKARLKDCTSILDIGCGTGNKTIHFQEQGRSIAAIDGDAGMIEEAKKKHAAPDIEYKVLDMTQIAAHFKPDSFDAALCLGNTLVHLPGAEGISDLLISISSLLKPGGQAIIQILNYEHILNGEWPVSLPLLETNKIRFTRTYEFSNCSMNFVTSLQDKTSGKEIKNSIPLYPLRKRELNLMLGEANFAEVAYYGSYRGDALTDKSFPLIAVAHKKA